MTEALQPLWQIEEELEALLDSIETCPEELQHELQQRITEYLAREATKVDQTAYVLAALDYEQEAAADEIARLSDRKRAAKASQDRLETYLCRIIAARGGKKLVGDTNTLSVRASDAVLILDEAAIPAQYIVEKVVVEKGGKVEIKKALKAGEEVPGADLEFRSSLVRK